MRTSGLSKAGKVLAAFWRGGEGSLRRKDISLAIDFGRVVLLTSLVFVHYRFFPNMPIDPKYGLNPDTHQIATFVNSFVTSLALGLIPLLSAISGWLFFSFKGPVVGPQIKRRIGSRFRSLYLFLIVWNLIVLIVLYAAYWLDLPIWGTMYARFDTFDAWDYVNAIFAINSWPINTPFWFVRDLFLTVLLSPLLWLMLRHAPIWGAMLMTVIWLGNTTFGLFFRTDIFAFFFFGGLLQVLNVPLQIGRRTTFILAAIALAFTLARSLGPLYLPEGYSYETFPLSVVMRIFRLIGVAACWGLFVLAARTAWGQYLARFGGAAIFIFASHGLVINAMKDVLWPLMPAKTDLWMLVHYALSISLSILIIVAVGLLLAQRAPSLFAFLTGGRVSNAPARALIPASSDTASRARN